MNEKTDMKLANPLMRMTAPAGCRNAIRATGSIHFGFIPVDRP